MSQSSSDFDTFTIERVYAAPLARVFHAFSDPQRKRRWFAEGASHEVEVFDTQFDIGGREHARYRFRSGTPFAGVALESDGIHLDIDGQRRIVIAATMSIGGRRISASLHTFEFVEEDGQRTRMLFTHQAAFFEGADGPAMRRAGWEQLFTQLDGALSGDA